MAKGTKAAYALAVAVLFGSWGISSDIDLSKWLYDNGAYILWGTRGKTPEGEAWQRCTTAISWTRGDYAYGVVAVHCLEGDSEFRPEGFYVVNPQTREKLPATILGYDPGGGNEVRIWKAKNAWGYKRNDRVSSGGGVRDGLYYCSFWPTLSYYSLVCDEGKAMAPFPSEPYRSAFRDGLLGDIIFSGPVFYGFSGGAVYTKGKGGLELAGIMNGFSMFSNISFAWSVPQEVLDVIDKAGQPPDDPEHEPEPEPKLGPELFPKGYENWDDEHRAHWRQALVDNAVYSVSYVTDAGYLLYVQDGVYRFTDVWAVIEALLDGNLKYKGRMREVHWNAFEIVPRE